VKSAAAGLALVLLALPAAAQRPRLSNGRVETRSAAAGLEATLRPLLKDATAPVWIGWSAASDRDRQMCCWDSRDSGCCSGCRLEGGSGNWSSSTSSRDGVVKLEGEREMFVLLRAEAGALSKLRSFSPDCSLDAGGTTLFWLEGVRPAESVRYLLSLADEGASGSTRKLADQALSALAFHAEPAAVDALIDRARKADSTHLRGQALFWLAQRAGDKAVQTIARALDEDPETDVKKKAVFALSQLPRHEGVPLLIQTARANKNPAVRKQAFFWLGQSKDARALAFFEEVLK
jgi:hypothetical protein